MAAATTVAFGGFLRSREFTYEAKDLRDLLAFQSTNILRSDVTFSDSNDYVIIALKRSKTDLQHKGVAIVISATDTATCPVKALCRLFTEDPRPQMDPLFRFPSKTFSYHNFVTELRKRLAAHGVPNSTRFTGHSLRRGAATTAKLNGMLNSDIQRLGRWSSEAFERYIDTDIAYRFRLNRQFLRGVSPAF